MSKRPFTLADPSFAFVLLAVALLLNGCGPFRRNRLTPTPETTPIATIPAATLYVYVQPDGATVWVNGERRGQTPLTLSLPAGDYTVRVGENGYTTLEQTVNLPAGGERILTDALAALVAPTQTPTPTGIATAILPTTPVMVTVTSVTIPTYPYHNFWQPRLNTELNFPYFYFDREAYEASHPTPMPQDYELVVMENEWLRLTFLPGLGGRIYEAIFKPTGNNEFYRNPVIKPSVWGPPEGNAGWLAAGGMEWVFPVVEHGYLWGVPWGYITLPGHDAATATLFDGAGDERLRVSVDVTLTPGEARFTIRPRIENPTDQPAHFHFWLNALLAPGAANRPSPDLRFIFPVTEMTVHTTTDPTLPEPMQPLAWPVYQGRDLSRLGNWQRYLGLFERPAAQGDFMGVYDEAADEGIVRVFPSDVARGAKAFAFGSADDNTNPSDYTDDGSGYVELHGGIAPTFWDEVTLAPGGSIQWTETWYPVAGIGGLTWADENLALHTQPVDGGLQVGLFPVFAVSGELQVTAAGTVVYQQPVALSPAAPFRQVVPLPEGAPARGQVTITLRDATGYALLAYAAETVLR